MIELIPFGQATDSPSSILTEVYETTQISKTYKRYRFLGNIVRDGKLWRALTQKKNTPDSTHKLRRDAIEALM